MKKARVIPLLCLICIIFCSCAAKRYTDTLSCKEVANELISKISAQESYKSYSKNEVSFLIDEDVSFDDCCFLYSSSSDDMSEIAVFHSSEPEALFDELCKYTDTLRQEKRSFVENYVPSEVTKLDDGQASRFGNYVVLAILERSERDTIFESAKEILSKK